MYSKKGMVLALVCASTIFCSIAVQGAGALDCVQAAETEHNVRSDDSFVSLEVAPSESSEVDAEAAQSSMGAETAGTEAVGAETVGTEQSETAETVGTETAGAEPAEQSSTEQSSVATEQLPIIVLAAVPVVIGCLAVIFSLVRRRRKGYE